MRPPKHRDPLAEAVAHAIPQRGLVISREVLLLALMGQLQSYLDTAPRDRARTERHNRCKELAGELKHVIESTEAALRRLGVRDSDMRAAAIAHRRTPELDLARVCSASMTRLREWELLWSETAKRGRPRIGAPKLIGQLKDYCDQAGLTRKEFAGLLADISNTNGLPTLSLETARKRRQRAGTK